MAPETNEIKQDIAATREQIDTHLQELTGRVRQTVNVGAQTRRKLPTVLAAVAGVGLLFGLFLGRVRRRRWLGPEIEEEDAVP